MDNTAALVMEVGDIPTSSSPPPVIEGAISQPLEVPMESLTAPLGDLTGAQGASKEFTDEVNSLEEILQACQIELPSPILEGPGELPAKNVEASLRTVFSKDPDLLSRILKSMGKVTRKAKGKKRPVKGGSTPPAPGAPVTEGVVANGAEAPNPPAGGVAVNAPTTPPNGTDATVRSAVGPRRRIPVCWNCREEGHRYSHCPLRVRAMFCRKCGRLGKTLATCPACSANWRLLGPYVPGVGTNVPRDQLIGQLGAPKRPKRKKGKAKKAAANAKAS